MIYNFDTLGPDNFEKLVQSLVLNIAGLNFQVFGDGPDGQREGLIENASFHLDERTIRGRTILQAKYKSPDGKEDDWTWLRKNLKKELDGFRKKHNETPDYVPNTWLFFTNIVLTPVKDSGIRDKATAFVKKYEDIIPNIVVCGHDDIARMLDNNRNVATSYLSFLTPGDVLKKLLEQQDANERKSHDQLRRYAQAMLRDDSEARTEQAGKLTDSQIKLEKVYIDLSAECHNEDGLFRCPGITRYIMALGDKIHRPPLSRLRGTERLGKKSQTYSNRLVLIANAGQGKSTLCQFICQIYRACFLTRQGIRCAEAEPYLSIEDFPPPKCARFPVEIILRDYASWIAEQGEASSSVLYYICNLVSRKTGYTLELDELEKMLQQYSWLFLFDGLDEVPQTSNRSTVLKRIQEFTDYDMVNLQCDHIVVCTTRPQGYTGDFSPEVYNHLNLLELSPEQCELYLQRLLRQMEVNESIRQGYMNTLRQSLEDDVVSRLMKTPLHTTIVAVLVKAGGKPPSNRYLLFKQYYETTIRREKQKNLPVALGDDSAVWSDDLHGQIAFILQKASEKKENADAMISVEECKKIISEYVTPETETAAEIKTQVDLIYQLMIQRLTFIGELRENKVGFSLRSMQEFFAAEYLVTNRQDQEIDKSIQAIGHSAYWRNTFLFMVGNIMRNRRFLEKSIYELCQRLNGSENTPGQHTIHSLAKAGSVLALDLLCENVFTANAQRNKYIHILMDGLYGDIDDAAFSQMYRLPEKVMDALLDSFVSEKLIQTNGNDDAAWAILTIAIRNKNENALNLFSELAKKLEWKKDNLQRLFLPMRRYNIDLLPDEIVNAIKNELLSSDEEIWQMSSDLESFAIQYIDDNEHELCQVVFRSLIANSIHRHPDQENKKNWISKLHWIGHYFSKNDSRYCFANTVWESFPKKVQMFLEDKQLYEYIYLNDFLVQPSYENFILLAKAYYTLPEVCKQKFSYRLSQANWFLREQSKKMQEFTSLDAYTAYMTANFYEKAKEEEQLAQKLYQANNYSAITANKLWKIFPREHHISNFVIESGFSPELPYDSTYMHALDEFVCESIEEGRDVPEAVYTYYLCNLERALQQHDVPSWRFLERLRIIAKQHLSKELIQCLEKLWGKQIPFVTRTKQSFPYDILSFYGRIMQYANDNGGYHPICKWLMACILAFSEVEMPNEISIPVCLCNFKQADSTDGILSCICARLCEPVTDEKKITDICEALTRLIQSDFPSNMISIIYFSDLVKSDCFGANRKWLLEKISPLVFSLGDSNGFISYLREACHRALLNMSVAIPVVWDSQQDGASLEEYQCV